LEEGERGFARRHGYKLRARKELLMKEKEWNRQRDALTAERRKLPMVG
jgi:predicted dithiol-disulfide oxidoreductase (DUF899 family)